MLPFPHQFNQGNPRAMYQIAPLMNLNMMQQQQQQPMFQQQVFMPRMPHMQEMVPHMGMLLGNQVRFKGQGGRGPSGYFPGNQFGPQGPQQPSQPYTRNGDLRNHLKRKASDPETSGRKVGRFQRQPQSLFSNFNTSSSTSVQQPPLIDGAKPIIHTPGQWCERITKAIVEYYNDYHQTQDDLNHKVILSQCLFAIVKGIFPGCRLFIVGSSMSGFGTHTSDMDLCLLVSQIQDIDQKNEAVHILSAIHKSLRQCTFIKSSQVIRAKVPILKFIDSSKSIECDLNINNGVGIRNTHLLKYYCLCDPRVAPLMLFIKYWARFHDINDAHKRTISSYSLALMLIHYLQVCEPPVLPCLQQLHPDRFGIHVDLNNLQLTVPLKVASSKNTQSLGSLFQGFLDYFAFTFRPDLEVISIRQGCVLDRYEVQMNSMEPNQWKCLCIEEPYDLSNTARSVFDDFVFQRVQRVFWRSAELLYEKGDVSAILRQPF